LQETILFYPSAPYYSQIEDFEQIVDYLDHGKECVNDPYWRKSGAPNKETYAHWATRSCGVVCIKTCCETFGGPALPLHQWIQVGLNLDGYLIKENDSDEAQEIGWKHAALAELLSQHGFSATPQSADLDEIIEALQNKKIVIASVSFEIGTNQPVTGVGGHLVTILGAVVNQSQIDHIILHNPSGRTRELREFAKISKKRFNQAFSHRVIIAGKE